MKRFDNRGGGVFVVNGGRLLHQRDLDHVSEGSKHVIRLIRRRSDSETEDEIDRGHKITVPRRERCQNCEEDVQYG